MQEKEVERDAVRGCLSGQEGTPDQRLAEGQGVMRAHIWAERPSTLFLCGKKPILHSLALKATVTLSRCERQRLMHVRR